MTPPNTQPDSPAQEHATPLTPHEPEHTPLKAEQLETEPPEAVALVPVTTKATATVKSKPHKHIPWYIGTMMLGHLAVSRDLGQHRVWKEKIEGTRMVQTLERVHGHKTRALLRKPRVWRMMRRTSTVATATNLAVSSAWLLWLIPLYATVHGFGWLAALTFLLPVPIAWKVGRRLYEDATIESLRDASRKSTALTSVRRVFGSAARSFTAGFGFGFTLLFLQGLISWFMTPAPTLLMELVLDTYIASMAGVLSGAVSALISPLINYTGHAALAAGRVDKPHQLKA